MSRMRVIKIKKIALILGACSTFGALSFLTACSNDLKPASQSVNNLSYNATDSYEPVPNQSTVPAPVVAQINPSSIPGQKMPMPTNNPADAHTNTVTLDTPVASSSSANSSSADTSGLISARGLAQTSAQTPAPAVTPAPAQTPQQIVSAMNQAAVQNPAATDFFNAMMTYDYSPGAVYTIYCAPLNLTDIVLEPGEKIISIAAGDTLRWQITQTYSGAVGALSQHIILKPNSPNLSNSLLITTDHRVYHMILKSTNNNSYMVQVQWHYQTSPLMFVSDQDQGYSAPGAMPGASATGGSPFQLDLANLDFSYEFGTVKGDKPDWYPTRVFNDGRQTFIEFPEDFYNSDLPVLYLQTGDKSYGTMFNWRLKGRYMVIDAVVKQARLESGVQSKKDQIIVQINHS